MRVTRFGEVTIPRDIMDAAGLSPDVEVRWEIGPDGVARLVPVANPEPAPTDEQIEAWLDALRGSATGGMTTDEVMALTRGE